MRGEWIKSAGVGLGEPAALPFFEDSGVTQIGSDNAFRTLPGAQARRLDALDSAFTRTNDIDPGSQMPEPSVVNIEKRARAAGRLAALRLHKIAAGMMGGISAPVAPTTTTTTYKPPKPVAALDPRTDKPEGQNMLHGVQTMSYGADVGDSYTSFSRRLQGSPV